MRFGIVGDRMFSNIESKWYATPTSVQCHRNIRDDKTAIELFLAGVRGWESGLLKRLDDAKRTVT
jgi:hypothetical protein